MKKLERSTILNLQTSAETKKTVNIQKNQQIDETKILFLSGELHFRKVELCPGVKTYSP